MNTGVKPNTNVQKESLQERIDRVMQDKNVKKQNTTLPVAGKNIREIIRRIQMIDFITIIIVTSMG